MISLIIKAQAVDYLTGAVLYASFEGNSLLIANQNHQTDDCDILIRGDFGVRARVGWNDEGQFFVSDVDFEDKLVEIITPEAQLCIDLDKGSSKVFKQIKNDVVIVNFNDEIELYLTSNRDLPETNNISPLGREVVTLTEQARKKIISIRTHRETMKLRKTGSTIKEPKHVKKGKEDIPEFTEFDIVKDDYKPKSDGKLYKKSSKEETAMHYGDVAWWASEGNSGLHDEYVPANDTQVDELEIDEDIDELGEVEQKDQEYYDEFDDEMQDTEESLEEMTKYTFEFTKNLYLMKTSEFKLRISCEDDEGQRITIIPRFPGCHVQPEKFVFVPEQYADDDEEQISVEETFYVTPFKVGSLRTSFFEFWGDGEILWRKFLPLTSVRMPVFFKIILGALLLILVGFASFILYFENLISVEAFNISVAATFLFAIAYILVWNKSTRYTEDAIMALESDDEEDDE